MMNLKGSIRMEIILNELKVLRKKGNKKLIYIPRKINFKTKEVKMIIFFSEGGYLYEWFDFNEFEKDEFIDISSKFKDVNLDEINENKIRERI